MQNCFSVSTKASTLFCPCAFLVRNTSVRIWRPKRSQNKFLTLVREVKASTVVSPTCSSTSPDPVRETTSRTTEINSRGRFSDRKTLHGWRTPHRKLILRLSFLYHFSASRCTIGKYSPTTCRWRLQ